MKALSPRQVMRFVPSCDRKKPSEQQTVFLLKPLTVEEEDILEDSFWRLSQNGQKNRPSFSSKCTMAVHLAIVKIENLEGVEGSVEPPREEIPDEFGVNRIESDFMLSIPKPVRDEIALFVLNGMSPTEEERKN
jgi:hypothetical protein